MGYFDQFQDHNDFPSTGGGFQPAPSLPDVGEIGGIAGNRAQMSGGTPIINDPRVTTQPQPYQQGPGGTISPIIGPNSPINDPYPGQGPGGLSGGLGLILGPAAQWMQGNNAPLQRQMAQANGVSPANLASGIGQPMNPSQQSGTVLMQSPDGLHMQQVPQSQVAHYTGLGATQVNGQQLSGQTGSSYGGG